MRRRRRPLRQLEAALCPSGHVARECRHVRRIGGDEILTSTKRPLEGFFEKGKGSSKIARQAEKPAAFKQHTCSNDVIVARERLHLVHESVPLRVTAAKTVDPGKLGHDLSSAAIITLGG